MRTLFILALLISVGMAAKAQGSLLITPKRVVMDGKKRTELLNLANSSNDTATYSISFVEIRMTEDGRFEEITVPDSSQQFASKFLRVFPRTVVLPPNEAQTVKLQIQRLGELQPGEYRSHLYFRAVPKAQPLGSRKTDSTLSINIVPIYGITIPVIIQSGISSANVSFDSLSFTRNDTTGASVKMSFIRTGNMSVYGDLQIEHVSKSGAATVVGLAKGIAVYAPTPRRRLQVPLTQPRDVDLRSGKLRITYTSQAVRPVILAQGELTL